MEICEAPATITSESPPLVCSQVIASDRLSDMQIHHDVSHTVYRVPPTPFCAGGIAASKMIATVCCSVHKICLYDHPGFHNGTNSSQGRDVKGEGRLAKPDPGN
jgi:hypothetical protein